MCTAIKQSNEAQKAMMKEIDLDKLEDMRDDMYAFAELVD